MSVPYAVAVPDQIPKERYYDPAFYALEAEQLWPRVWQMACRLEEIPGVGDFVEYELLDQSVIEPGPPTPPIPRSFDDERIPPIPTQDFSNLPRQQRGLHNAGFEYMRLSEGAEGGIANFERTLDGFLAGRPYDQLEAALRAVNVNPLEQPVVDLGF
jgi:hypothetical protein